MEIWISIYTELDRDLDMDLSRDLGLACAQGEHLD